MMEMEIRKIAIKFKSNRLIMSTQFHSCSVCSKRGKENKQKGGGTIYTPWWAFLVMQIEECPTQIPEIKISKY